MLRPGDSAPDFELVDAEMAWIRLAAYRGRHVVLCFYPRDGSPGGVLEMTEFSDHEEDFLRSGAVVLGISGDDCLQHAAFASREGVAIPLLSDPEGEVARLYGAWRQGDDPGGDARRHILRSTFVIDKEGVLRHALYGVTAIHGHALEVLHLVKELNA